MIDRRITLATRLGRAFGCAAAAAIVHFFVPGNREASIDILLAFVLGCTLTSWWTGGGLWLAYVGTSREIMGLIRPDMKSADALRLDVSTSVDAMRTRLLSEEVPPDQIAGLLVVYRDTASLRAVLMELLASAACIAIWLSLGGIIAWLGARMTRRRQTAERAG